MKFVSITAGKLLAAAALSVFACGAFAQKTQLTVYTALETDQLKAYKEGFEKANPNIEITWVRDSTGIVTAKLLAEKANPKADVVMGLAATSMAIFDNEGMLVPYAPPGLNRISAQYRDPKESSNVGRDGRVGRHDLLQHCRGREAQYPEAGNVA